MIPLFLPLLLTVPAATQLIESWECGSDAVPNSKKWAQLVVSRCSDAVQEGANLCCKEHDLCYEVHSLRSFTQEYCDIRFCNCLQDINDKAKDSGCDYTLYGFCWAVKTFAGTAFVSATPTNHTDKFVKFVDLRPLGLEMQPLVDACFYSKIVAVHCHNSVYTCLKNPHEREKIPEKEADYGGKFVKHSYEDCRSTMYDCLQVLIDSEASEKCAAIARSLSKQANTYMELDEEKHGRSIIQTYPIVAARLLKQCTRDTEALETCYLSFDFCAEDNRRENPEIYNAVRRINIECHKNLSKCIEEAIRCNVNLHLWRACHEAKDLAVSRIRKDDLAPTTFGSKNPEDDAG